MEFLDFTIAVRSADSTYHGKCWMNHPCRTILQLTSTWRQEEVNCKIVRHGDWESIKSNLEDIHYKIATIEDVEAVSSYLTILYFRLMFLKKNKFLKSNHLMIGFDVEASMSSLAKCTVPKKTDWESLKSKDLHYKNATTEDLKAASSHLTHTLF